MTPNQATTLAHFSKWLGKLEGEELIDRWIAFDGSAASREPDLGIGKSLAFEARLIHTIGFDYAQRVEQRRATVAALNEELADKKEMLNDLDTGKVTLPAEQLSSFRARVAELETRVGQINANRT